MENKQIHEMTNEEILRQQLELLAAVSKEAACIEDLPQFTLAMVEIYKVLVNDNKMDTLFHDCERIEALENEVIELKGIVEPKSSMVEKGTTGATAASFRTLLKAIETRNEEISGFLNILLLLSKKAKN